MVQRPVQITTDNNEYNETLVATDAPSTAGQIPMTGQGGLLSSDMLPAPFTSVDSGIEAWNAITNNGTTIASAEPLDLDAATGDTIDVSGTDSISTVVLTAGNQRLVRFTGACTLVHSATLVLPGGANIVTVAGDYALFRGYASDVVRVLYFDVQSFPAEYFVCLAATHTLDNVATEQGLFDSVGTGTLTIPAGTYFFEALVSISSMDATSGNASFDILGAGTATLGSVLYAIKGVDGAVATAAAAVINMSNAAQSTAAMVTAATETALQAEIRGTFRATVGGTIIPSVTLANAAAAVVAVGSFFRCRRVGAVATTTRGPWS